MNIAVLASGSSGNAIYIEADDSTRLLIDAGLSARRIKSLLANIDRNVDTLSAILVSHEHSDHIRGIRILQKYHNIPVFVHKKTYRACKKMLGQTKCSHFSCDNSFMINNAVIRALPVAHDAANPVGFIIACNNQRVGVFTDLGHDLDDTIARQLPRLDAIVLESNYDNKMLVNGRYPLFLKERILSSDGHLSNEDAGALIHGFATDRLKHVFLAHLSLDNNLPEKAIDTVKEMVFSRDDLKHINIHLTFREKSTNLITI